MSSQNMSPPSGRVKRAYKRRAITPAAAISVTPLPLPRLPALDPLEAAQETARNAQEGNLKLAKSVETLRETLETIVSAEMDRMTGLAVQATELRALAVAGLERYSAISGQSWRRHKLTGPTRAGDRDLATLEEG